MAKKIIIVGSGIAGLSAGVYARMNGYETEIYEMGANPGGLCTAWKRKDFLFDGCIHWLTGSDPSSGYYHLWEEIGGIQGKKFHNYDYYVKIRDRSSEDLTVYNDPQKLKSEFLKIAPEDEKIISRLAKDIVVLMKNELPAEFSSGKIMTFIRVLRILFRYRMTAVEFAQKFKSKKLQDLFINHMDWNGMSIGFSFWVMAMMAGNKAGYPLGGSKAFIDSIMEKYEHLGGKIYYHSKVEKILTNDGKATGIRLSDGREIPADIVISAADGHSTIFDWLEGKYINKKIKNLYESLVPFSPLVMVYLGIRGDFSSEDPFFSFKLKEPLEIAGKKFGYLPLKIYNSDPAIAPEGKTVFMIMLSTEYEFWKNLHQDREAYSNEKKRIEEQVINALSCLYPDIAERIEASDVCTPMTFIRYTGNWRGSYQGWVMNKDSFTKYFPQTLPGLENFYMAGHWVSPGGGLPSGVITGRKAIKMICRADKKEFTAFS